MRKDQTLLPEDKGRPIVGARVTHRARAKAEPATKAAKVASSSVAAEVGNAAELAIVLEPILVASVVNPEIAGFRQSLEVGEKSPAITPAGGDDSRKQVFCLPPGGSDAIAG